MATGNRIKDQLAGIMEDNPEAQADEDWLAALWLDRQGLIPWSVDFPITLSQVALIINRYRTADIRRRRQEMAADGSYPWPTDEAERRQKRAKGGAPG